jgi:hypothetical protein
MKKHAVVAFSMLSLCLLVGCGAAPAGATSARTATISPTLTAIPTATPDRDPFQVHFLQHYKQFLCTPGPQLPVVCYTLQDDPSASSLGVISFAGTDTLYSKVQGTSCGPAERSGAFKLADGDTITIHATGTYCVPGYAVQFTFTVTGGTGHYRHAHGSGTIAVGDAGPTTAPEFWSGTISA